MTKKKNYLLLHVVFLYSFELHSTLFVRQERLFVLHDVLKTLF